MANAWHTANSDTFLRVRSRRGAVASCIMGYPAACCERFAQYAQFDGFQSASNTPYTSTSVTAPLPDDGLRLRLGGLIRVVQHEEPGSRAAAGDENKNDYDYNDELLGILFLAGTEVRVNLLDAPYPCVNPMRPNVISDPSARITRTPAPFSTFPIAVTGTSHSFAIASTTSPSAWGTQNTSS